ncbi:ATP-dependent DNA helicase PIF1 [Corchorus olitorius]|uniref:ATP-dependent DNA helicase PIF1 n=1 Tax=Corchorus olitorius TaxID=93759 RepID=A0A1R3JG33_9ROSI|nr:ATP-dependent DNA helicase PIF1 [Corchorus olitorius]
MRPSVVSSKSANINSINRLRRLNRIRNKRISKQFPIPRNFDHARATLGIAIGEANLQNNLRRSRAFNYAGRSCSIIDGPNDEDPAHHITSWVCNEDHIRIAIGEANLQNNLRRSRAFNYAGRSCSIIDGPNDEDPAHHITSWVCNEDHIRKCSQPENLGPPKYQCKHCKAWMWYEERTNITRPTTNPVFSLCCKEGTIKLPAVRPMPQFLKQLHYDETSDMIHFKEKIRLYNSMFQFTSMGAKVDTSINDSRGPYVFQTLGFNYHLIGSVLPVEGKQPTYAQLYIVDTANEQQNQTLDYISLKENNDYLELMSLAMSMMRCPEEILEEILWDKG